MLLIFDSNGIYAVSSSLSDTDSTKVFEVGNPNYIINIQGTSIFFPVYLLLYWYIDYLFSKIFITILV